MKITVQRFGVAVLLASAVGAAIYAFRPKPVPVETALAAAGPLAVSIDEEGRTRAHDRYTVAAPTAGRLERVALHAGDPLTRGQAVAVLRLAPLDPREREEAEARLRAAEALRCEAAENAARAAADTARAAADAEQAARERERAEQLQAKGYIPLQELEQARSAETAARSAETAARKSAEAARFRVQAAASEVEVAKAALLAGEEGAADGRRRLILRAPVDGRVLRVLEESERVVPAGTPVIEIGDPSRLEVVVEVLSTDAVRVRPGMAVQIGGWGGAGTLPATVRTVEPAAFTKISALGVEEQRVNVIVEISGPPGTLGDGYRVEARIVTWSEEAVLKVPASALFRRAAAAGTTSGPARGSSADWAVFTVSGGRARLRSVQPGHRTAAEVEILEGVAAGERVVLHPPNELRDGLRVSTR
jgi:HlyD family secretion protein